jgi:two-component system, chemotaxis family, chemotaxis protein CheY
MSGSTEHAAASARKQQTGAERKRILVVDDSDAVRDVIRTFLENTGFEVCGEASDGVEAIEKATKLKPNLIVLDLSMPGMNGVEAAAALGQLLPEVPVVVLTMYGDLLGEAMAAGLAVKAVVGKADGMMKLVECVQRLLATNSPAAVPDQSLPDTTN